MKLILIDDDGATIGIWDLLEKKKREAFMREVLASAKAWERKSHVKS